MTYRTAEELKLTAHRPYPPPQRPWLLSMRWHDLLFMHWPVPAATLRPLIPPALELDTFEGSAWLGVVPFRMSGVKPRLFPNIPGLSAFPELNLRTYVSAGDKPGIWFFSLDAHNPVAVRLARAAYRLPYFDARMSCESTGEEVRYRSVRTHKDAPPARFAGRYRPLEPLPPSRPGTLEYFLTERYCLYTAEPDGRPLRGEIHHAPWPLQRAEAGLEELEMTAQIGVELPDTEPLLHFARRLDMVAWLTRKVEE
jgi:uncharacterized protein YqjF (DUF2071 family)